MPITAIVAALTQVKAATDIITVMLSLKSTADINLKAIELQNIILQLQSSLSLHQQIHFQEITERQNAEKKLMEMEKWEKASAQYEHQKLGITGINVYARKPFVCSVDRDTYICPNCYNKRATSFLQIKDRDNFSYTLVCSNVKECNLSLEIIEQERPDDYDEIRNNT